MAWRHRDLRAGLTPGVCRAWPIASMASMADQAPPVRRYCRGDKQGAVGMGCPADPLEGKRSGQAGNAEMAKGVSDESPRGARCYGGSMPETTARPGATGRRPRLHPDLADQLRSRRGYRLPGCPNPTTLLTTRSQSKITLKTLPGGYQACMICKK